MQIREFSWKTIDGLTLYSKEWNPENPPKASVVLIHGLGEHIGRYEHVAAAMTNAGYILRGFDLRGHGQSEGTRGHADSYDQIALDIDQFIRETRENHPSLPVFLYGHSLGGALVLFYGETHQGILKGIIATSPGLAPTNPLSTVKMIAARILSKVAPKSQLKNDLDLTGLSRDPQVAEKYVADPLVHPLISARLGLELINKGIFIRDHANQIAVPLLLLQGTADRLVNPPMTAEFAKLVPQNLITFHTYEGYYHELHNEPEKEQIIQTMIRWLDAHLA
jgi:alpha-beta hydrolase superfamily lysophospholipase